MATITTARGPEAGATAATELFDAEFGAAPAGVWAAPGRVNLIGEHVDYARGVCLPFALDLITVVAASPREDTVIRAVSALPDGSVHRGEVDLAEVRQGHPGGWLGYVAGTVLCLGYGQGMDLAIVSDVPLGSGLSSSAALECAVAIAAAELARHEITEAERETIRAACIRAENEVVGASTGGLDQSASLFGQSRSAVKLDFLDDTHERVDADFAASGLCILVSDTNAPHANNDGQYESRRGVIDLAQRVLAEQGLTVRDEDAARVVAEWSRTPEAAASLRELVGEDADAARELLTKRVRHVISETARTERAIELLAAKDFRAFGEAMVGSHCSLKEDLEVVTPELDSAVEAALAAGALGARMVGGGFGGSTIALCAQDELQGIADAIAAGAEQKGFPEPSFFRAQPSEGARRVR